MIVEPTRNLMLIGSVLFDDAIVDKIAQDSDDGFDLELTDSELWLSIHDGGKLVGVCAFDNVRGICCDIHPYILPEHRIKSRDAVSAALTYLFSNHAQIHKVNATIPVIYPKVRNFALKIGFVPEGINRRSFMKHGVIYDQWVVGIMRSEHEFC